MNQGIISGFANPLKAPTVKNLGAGVVTDPRLMPVGLVIDLASYLYYKNAYNSSNHLSAATPPDFNATTITGTASKNIVSLSGSGTVTHIISHNFANNANVDLTVTINVDGITYILTAVVPQSYRWILGVISNIGAVPENASTATFNSNLAKGLFNFGSAIDTGHVAKSGKSLVHNSNYYSTIPSISQVCAAGLPRLRFEKNFSVDIALSAFTTSTGANNYAYVGYVMD